MFLAVVGVTLMILAPSASFGQKPSTDPSVVITIEGTIRDAAGRPVAGASVILEEKGNAGTVEAKTNGDGSYVLTSAHAGTYTVRAGKSGFSDSVADAIVLSLGEKKRVDLVLEAPPEMKAQTSPALPSPKASQGAMEFKDEPSFTVAGVTDWSNLGLHGSAASSKTSESLAKETSALKSGEPGAASAGVPSARYGAALAYREKGDFAAARREVLKALANADNAEGHRLLGELDEKLNEPLEAVREYEHATRMEPSEENYFEWGTELLLHKAAEPAVEVFTRGSGAHPDSARMLTGLGAALYASGSWEEAARRLCQASDLEPDDAAPYLFLGEMEKTTPAPLPCGEEKLARFAQEQPGNAQANYYYAITVWKRAKGSESAAGFQQGEKLLNKAVALQPRFDEAYLQLGVMHFARGDFEQAIGDCNKAIAVNPHLGEAHRQLGLLYQRTGESAKAQREFDAYEQIEKIDAAESERQRRELRQFLIILKDQPAGASPH